MLRRVGKQNALPRFGRLRAETMARQIARVLLCVSTLGTTPMLAAQETYVPLSEEPRHRLVLENDLVRAVEVTLPPDETTLFHEHTLDVVTVTLEGADLVNQVWQKQPTSVQRATGRVSYTAYQGGSHVHRVENAGQSTFRIIAIELYSPAPTTDETHAARTGLNELALDSDRVRIWRLALEPGQSAGLPALPLPTIRVTQTGGRVLETIGAGSTAVEKTTRSGELSWLEPGTDVTVRNSGDSLVVYYDVEIK